MTAHNQPADALREVVRAAIENVSDPGIYPEPCFVEERTAYLDAILTALHASGLVEKGETRAATGKRHELKTWPRYFEAVLKGDKTFEIRKADRDFQPGDILELREYDPSTWTYTGRSCERVVTYLTDWEQKAGVVVMAIAGLSASAISAPAKVEEARADGHSNLIPTDGKLESPDGAKETDAAQTLPARYPGEKTERWWVTASFARTLELQRNALRREVEEAKQTNIGLTRKFLADVEARNATLAKTQAQLTAVTNGRNNYAEGWDDHVRAIRATHEDMKRQLAQAQRERDEAKNNTASWAEVAKRQEGANILHITQLQAATQELEGLRADRERLDWLDSTGKLDPNPNINATKWWRHIGQQGMDSTVRTAIDSAMLAARTKETPRHD